ncbi:Acyl-coenzyme A oxidase 2 [Diplonema papillatum]|nr:Acyl-coenzyme A oxidase 2 [Diplonema papillatum]
MKRQLLNTNYLKPAAKAAYHFPERPNARFGRKTMAQHFTPEYALYKREELERNSVPAVDPAAGASNVPKLLIAFGAAGEKGLGVQALRHLTNRVMYAEACGEEGLPVDMQNATSSKEGLVLMTEVTGGGSANCVGTTVTTKGTGFVINTPSPLHAKTWATGADNPSITNAIVACEPVDDIAASAMRPDEPFVFVKVKIRAAAGSDLVPGVQLLDLPPSPLANSSRVRESAPKGFATAAQQLGARAVFFENLEVPSESIVSSRRMIHGSSTQILDIEAEPKYESVTDFTLSKLCSAAVCLGDAKRTLKEVITLIERIRGIDADQNHTVPIARYNTVQDRVAPLIARTAASTLALRQAASPPDGSQLQQQTYASALKIAASELSSDCASMLAELEGAAFYASTHPSNDVGGVYKVFPGHNASLKQLVTRDYLDAARKMLYGTGTGSLAIRWRDRVPVLWRVGSLNPAAIDVSDPQYLSDLLRHKLDFSAYRLCREIKDVTSDESVDGYSYYTQSCGHKVSAIADSLAESFLYQSLKGSLRSAHLSIAPTLQSWTSLLGLYFVQKSLLFYIEDGSISSYLVGRFEESLREFTQDLMQDAGEFLNSL